MNLLLNPVYKSFCFYVQSIALRKIGLDARAMKALFLEDYSCVDAAEIILKRYAEKVLREAQKDEALISGH